MTSRIPRFAAYATAFEKAYVSDEWSEVESFFADDAIYEVGLPEPMGGRFEGRAAILAYFPQVLDDFDRRFASREIELLEGPRETGDQVWIKGRAIYRSPGVPELSFDLEETVRYDGDQIVRLEDRYDAENLAAIQTYLAEHGPKLGMPAR